MEFLTEPGILHVEDLHATRLPKRPAPAAWTRNPFQWDYLLTHITNKTLGTQRALIDEVKLSQITRKHICQDR